MTAEGPLLDELRAAIHTGLAALETLTTAMGQARAGRMRPGERRYARTVVDRLARRIVAWQEIVGDDEPELRAQLRALADRVRVRGHRSRAACLRRRQVELRLDERTGPTRYRPGVSPAPES